MLIYFYFNARLDICEERIKFYLNMRMKITESIVQTLTYPQHNPKSTLTAVGFDMDKTFHLQLLH